MGLFHPLPFSLAPNYFSQSAEFQVFLKVLIGLTFLPPSSLINTALYFSSAHPQTM